MSDSDSHSMFHVASICRAQEEHVLDLQLVACRKKYRGNGIGRHLMKVMFHFFNNQSNRSFYIDVVINESRLYW